jgi:hypothetical protein
MLKLIQKKGEICKNLRVVVNDILENYPKPSQITFPHSIYTRN